MVKERINEVGVNRIGVVVAKSVDKRASQRNFFERQVKSQFLKAPNKQKDFIVTLFPGVTKLTKRQFSEEIVKIFEK